jgi:hypothetical protein
MEHKPKGQNTSKLEVISEIDGTSFSYDDELK